MMRDARQTYLTETILSAEPLELIRLLYAGATESVEQARAHLANHNIRGRSAAISKAVAILSSLAWSLDHGNAPALSGRLAALYDYMQRRLLEANIKQLDAPLAEVLGILHTVADAWKKISAPPGTPVSASVWTSLANQCQSEPATQGWSF